MKRVYLAGPISGLSYEEAIERRRKAVELLKPLSAISPMRGKEELRGRDIVGNEGGYKGLKSPFNQPSGIVARDRHDVTSCDAILMDLESSRETGQISIGTMVELGWADMLRRPVVVVWGTGESDATMYTTNPNPHDHIFVRQLAGFHVETLEEACDVLKKILLPYEGLEVE